MPPSFVDPAAAQSYLWLIIALPLLGALVNGVLGRRLGKANVAFIGIAALVGSFALSLVAFALVAGGRTLHFQGGTWFRVGPAEVAWGLLFDRLSGTLSLVVTGVGSLIHVYSASYMSHEDDFGYARFFTYLNLFVAAMMTLVLGDSLVLTFVGWEGVGLCSYLLIGFWYTDEQKAYCGRKAFVANRIGDFGFLLGVFTLLALFGTASYDQLAHAVHGATGAERLTQGLFAQWTLRGALTLATLFLFLGCTGKSAQLPLYVWLPDAMAGPTPVSALIHAATMVTAGVYLVARTGFLFALAPASLAVVMLVGAATAVLAAAIAFAQNDIKKVLAYSTVSQLGFMFIGVGAGVFYAGVLHLVTHAFFKACLFLGAGSVMHGMREDTDIRNMGGLRRKMPWTAWTFAVATVTITGVVPIFSGFFSKDAILGGALGSHNALWPWAGPLAYALGTVAAAGTAFYMTRLYWLTFEGEPRTEAAAHAHESSPVMYVPLVVLAALSVVAALLGLPAFERLGRWGEVFGRFVEPVFEPALVALQVAGGRLGEGVHLAPFAVAFGVALIFTYLAWQMYGGGLRQVPGWVATRLPGLYRFTVDKFRVDELYDFFVLRPVMWTARTLWSWVDDRLIERVFVNGIPGAAGWIGKQSRRVQSGDAQRYAAIMAIAAVLILWYVLRGGLAQ